MTSPRPLRIGILWKPPSDTILWWGLFYKAEPHRSLDHPHNAGNSAYLRTIPIHILSPMCIGYTRGLLLFIMAVNLAVWIHIVDLSPVCFCWYMAVNPNLNIRNYNTIYEYLTFIRESIYHHPKAPYPTTSSFILKG